MLTLPFNILQKKLKAGKLKIRALFPEILVLQLTLVTTLLFIPA
jgi:hypothetical protein